MENQVSSHSPERPKSVKVSYLDRIKRKRGSASHTEDFSDLESNNGGPTQNTPTSLPPSGHKRSLSSMPPPLSKGPKRIEVHLPGPSPTKRARRNSADPQDEGKDFSGKASLHCHTSSISSVGRVPRQKISPSRSVKPISLVGAKIAKSKQSVTSDVDEDDTVSIAESSKDSIRTRRTEPERMQIFTEHPECGDMEPHRVHCKKCSKWVNLGRRQTYEVRPWEKHREKCDKAIRLTQSPKAGHAPDEEPDDDSASTVAPSISQSVTSVRRTESQRRAFFESDPRAEEVKPTEALCKKCQKWVKLSTRQLFSLSNWDRHQQRCSGALPSNRIATAERKLMIVNDSQAKAFTSRSVECAACGTDILLGGDYDLTKWEEHKVHCSSLSQSSRIASPNPPKQNKLAAVPEPASLTPVVRPPPSTASTDGTLIASDRSSTTRQGLKRPSEARDEEARPHKRARADSYKPAENEASGPLGWFLLPFRTFVRGFREGLQS